MQAVFNRQDLAAEDHTTPRPYTLRSSPSPTTVSAKPSTDPGADPTASPVPLTAVSHSPLGVSLSLPGSSRAPSLSTASVSVPRPSGGPVPFAAAIVHEHSSPPSILDARPFQNKPEDFAFDLQGPLYMSGNANKVWPSNAMSESRSPASTSDPGRPGSRGRSHSQAANPSRPQQLRQSFQAPLYPAPHTNALPESVSASAAASPSFQSVAASYQGPPLAAYGQRGPFVGQYTMSPQPPVTMPQYAYAPHHPGLHAPDTTMHPPQNTLLGYNPNTLVPMVQSPLYQGYGHSPEGSSSSSQSHSFPGSPGPSALYSHSAHSHSQSPAHASPPSPLNPQGSGPHPQTIHPSHSSPYAGQSPYAPMRYSTPPFPYPPHSYAPSPSLYATPSYGPSHYPPHSYAPSPETSQEGQGTWWYLPPARPGPTSGQYESFQNAYSMSFGVQQRDIDAYSQPPGSSPLPSPLYAVSPRQPPGPIPYSPTQALPPPAFPDAQQLTRPPSEAGPSQRPRASEAGPSASSSVRSGAAQPRRGQPRANPPAQRSDWVMWVGNVPSDTSHDELWRFLSRAPTPPAASATSSASSASSPDDVWGGVISIFLISRSNCAFVNFSSEAHLLAAIRHFNGQQLRSGDPRCPRLVCRIRGREDDLKAGVGGQRGTGLHVRWIRDQKEKARAMGEEARSPTTSEPLTTPSSSPSDPAPLLAHLNLSDDEGGRGPRYRPHPQSSSSGSYASTNSSILMQHFPKRYFILKSLTQKDLDISVKEGLWATQKHNELTLDQAFRTSKEVYLIFGVNKSGEFYGYARMVGPIQRGEHRVSWSSRADSPSHRRTGRSSLQSAGGSREPIFFSPAEHRWEESPLPVSPDPLSQSQTHAPPPSSGQRKTLQLPTQSANAPPRHSAPPEMHRAHRQLSRPTTLTQPQTANDHEVPRAQTQEDDHARSLGMQPQTASDAEVPRTQTQEYDHTRSLELQAQVNETIARGQTSPEEFELDPRGPLRHVREHSAPPQSAPEEARRWESVPHEALETVAEEGNKPGPEDAGPTNKEGPAWGEPFKVQWIRTDRLPFYRTRHLRNPWNHDREVKVSRDGTELEPTVGQALLEEWEKPAPPTPAGTPAGDRRPRGEEALATGASNLAPSAGEGG